MIAIQRRSRAVPRQTAVTAMAAIAYSRSHRRSRSQPARTWLRAAPSGRARPAGRPAAGRRSQHAVAGGWPSAAGVVAAALGGGLPSPRPGSGAVPSPPPSARSAAASARSVYVVQPGDTLWTLARGPTPTATSGRSSTAWLADARPVRRCAARRADPPRRLPSAAGGGRSAPRREPARDGG